EIAPAAASRRTTVASSEGTRPARIFEPPVVRTPAVSNKSFNPNGTPCSEPRELPAASSPSAAHTALHAAPAVIVTKQPERAAGRAMRSTWARTTSTGEISLVAISRDSSATDAQQRSATSHHSVLRDGLHVGDRQRLEPRERLERALDGGEQRLQLRRGQLEPGQARGPAQRLDVDRRHAREDTMKARGA